MFKKLLCFICLAACLLSLFGCAGGSAMTYPADVSAIDGFECICSEDGETEFVIEGENAKELYTYIAGQWEKADETEGYSAEQARIYLSFSDAEENFYGVFWIYENDYVVFTAMPEASLQKYYKFPAGTYEVLTEMIEK